MTTTEIISSLRAAADELERMQLSAGDTVSQIKSYIDERLTASETKQSQMKDTVMKEVQDLVDAVTAQGVAIAASNAEMVKVEAHAADLEAKVAALPTTGAAIDPADLAAIVTATGTITASVASLKASMPVPVAAPVVAAVVDAVPTVVVPPTV